MILWMLIFCAVVVSKGELSRTEKDKTLCYHNTLRQITSNCMYPVGRKVNDLVSTWNKTLEYFAHVYSRPTYIYDEHIANLMDFCRKANLIQISYRADHHEG
ncbi:hypothetical protein PHET_11267 [Paragonimus heterotremus]|uniref:SCP domain-containing protein n=1 Tax=Paragonimus heterotremus TaxID=100268 RepID=A0A8J4WDV1_9TREM|nr:hypothetical protein PHET_11267 [Paragonimus heterotremus]